jgi:RHS repeat-associated protein
VANGTITTFVSGPGGLLVVYTGTTPMYPIYNGHGDVVGNTDVNGTFTATPVTDEFGIGDVGPNRLGWLGRHERFTTGGTLDLIRMGVRLYDPSIGRFTSTDPIEGGSANDYDYVSGDPVNNYDLAGTVCWSCARKFVKRNFLTAKGLANFAGQASVWLGRAALVVAVGPLILGTGGTTAVVIGAAATAASAVEWGAAGTTGFEMSATAANAVAVFANGSRQGVYEVMNATCR